MATATVRTASLLGFRFFPKKLFNQKPNGHREGHKNKENLHDVYFYVSVGIICTKLLNYLEHDECGQVCKTTHKNELYQWPFPAVGFLFDYCQGAHTLHGECIE